MLFRSDKSVDQALWRLRMEVLRVMHRPDEFELAALNYCVTYEVSPPSWESAQCSFKALNADGSDAPGHTMSGEAFQDSTASTLNGALGDGVSDSVSPTIPQRSTIELAGQVLGDATAELAALDDQLPQGDVIIISCDRLVRVDFSAAGTLLNWVSARHAEGREVQFRDVNRLTAAFFNVIGIGEVAKIVPRAD